MDKQLASVEQRLKAEEEAKIAKMAAEMHERYNIPRPEFGKKLEQKQRINEERPMTTAAETVKPKRQAKRRASIGSDRHDWKSLTFKAPPHYYQTLGDILREKPQHSMSSYLLEALMDKVKKDRVSSAIEID